MSPTSSKTPKVSEANEHSLRQQHNENTAKGILKNAEMVSNHRSMQDNVPSSGDDVPDKRTKQALADAHMVSWLRIPQAYEHGESEECRQVRLRAGFTRMDQVGLGENSVTIDRREGDDKDETLSRAQGATSGLEGFGAWA